MSLYESGYFCEGRNAISSGKYYGTISLINNALIFFGKDDRQVQILLDSIEEIKSKKSLVQIVQKDNNIWTFLISPKSSTLTFSQISECKSKAHSMGNLLRYLLNDLKQKKNEEVVEKE
ncbi:MAG: hypothetical protein ACFFCV_13005 [Promethearchaeota archaeon]